MNRPTFLVGNGGHPVDHIRHRHAARIEHLLVELFLLQRLELVFQFLFVQGFSDVVARNSSHDFFAECVLLS